MQNQCPNCGFFKVVRSGGAGIVKFIGWALVFFLIFIMHSIKASNESISQSDLKNPLLVTLLGPIIIYLGSRIPILRCRNCGLVWKLEKKKT